MAEHLGHFSPILDDLVGVSVVHILRRMLISALLIERGVVERTDSTTSPILVKHPLIKCLDFLTVYLFINFDRPYLLTIYKHYLRK